MGIREIAGRDRKWQPADLVNDEVDEVRWLPFAVAARDLTYPHDRAVLRALVQSLVDVDPS